MAFPIKDDFRGVRSVNPLCRYLPGRIHHAAIRSQNVSRQSSQSLVRSCVDLEILIPTCTSLQVGRVPDPHCARGAARGANLLYSGVSPLHTDDEHDSGVAQGTSLSSFPRCALTAFSCTPPSSARHVSPPRSSFLSQVRAPLPRAHGHHAHGC